MKSNELENKRPTLFLLGMIAALSSILMAFEWRTEGRAIVEWDALEIDGVLIEPDLVAVIIDVPEEKTAPVAPAPASQSTSHIIEVVPDAMPVLDRGTPAPVLALRKPINERPRSLAPVRSNTVAGPRSFKGLQPHEMPYLRKCGHITDDIERFQCTQMELRNYVGSTFRIPSIDELPDMPEKVAVKFTIDKNGNIIQVDSGQDDKRALDKEVIRVMEGMPEMVPATVSGQRVPVRFELPIRLERE